MVSALGDIVSITALCVTKWKTGTLFYFMPYMVKWAVHFLIVFIYFCFIL